MSSHLKQTRRRRSSPNDLNPSWRIALAILGAVLLVGGIVAWIWPPRHSKLIPAATGAAGSRATAKVDDPSETLSGLLMGLGAVLLLVAANGRKLVSLKVGNEELVFSVARRVAWRAKREAEARGLPPAQAEAAWMNAFTAALPAAQVDPSALDADAIAEQAVADASR